MQEEDEETTPKHPTEMTTDESLDYLFAPEIAEELRRQAGKVKEPECPDSED